MAEFTKVWNNWKRMCATIIGNGDGSCVNCNLCSLECNVEYPKNQNYFDGKIIEGIVLEWAAEHPEPVYPTWEEWLITQGVIKENPSGGVGWPAPKLFERIPADIAQKLGIDTKEG